MVIKHNDNFPTRGNTKEKWGRGVLKKFGDKQPYHSQFVFTEIKSYILPIQSIYELLKGKTKYFFLIVKRGGHSFQGVPAVEFRFITVMKNISLQSTHCAIIKLVGLLKT